MFGRIIYNPIFSDKAFHSVETKISWFWTSRSSRSQYSQENTWVGVSFWWSRRLLFLKNFNTHRKTSVLESLFSNCGVSFSTVLKRDSNTGASYKYGETFKTSFFFRTPSFADSQNSLFLHDPPAIHSVILHLLLCERSLSFASFVEHFKTAT